MISFDPSHCFGFSFVYIYRSYHIIFISDHIISYHIIQFLSVFEVLGDERSDGLMDGCLDGWMDGWMVLCVCVVCCAGDL